MSSTGMEVVFEPADELTPREQELEAYDAAVKHLDPDDILHSACAILPFQQSAALMDLIIEQLSYPFEDISRAIIHPDKATRVYRAVLEAVAVAIDGMSEQRVMGIRR